MPAKKDYGGLLIGKRKWGLRDVFLIFSLIFMEVLHGFRLVVKSLNLWSITQRRGLLSIIE